MGNKLPLAEIVKPKWGAPSSIVAGTTVRSGGVSESPYTSNNMAFHVGDLDNHVRTNRRNLIADYPNVSYWQWLNQVHSNKIHIVESSSNQLIDADALYTRQEGVGLCIMTADCLPVFFASKTGDQIAIAHAGWRGLAGGVLENTLSQFDCSAVDIQTWLGPSIGPCHFEVGDDVLEAFRNIGLPQTCLDESFLPTSNEKYLADLHSLAAGKLELLGVTAVAGEGLCTVCDSSTFYSYRRDGITGRHLNFIFIKPSN